ncbi:MAG: glycerophosphodiester phosphodiesterase family protein, partial [Cyclobacteriaceae bacterium]
VRLFDCGSKPHARFPDQEKIKTRKPLLSEVIDTVEQYISGNHLEEINYNIEIKSDPSRDGTYHPEPEKFAQLVLAVITDKDIKPRTTIQSFDVRSLQEARKQAPEMTLALLIENDLSVTENIESLGFKPNIYSPDYQLVDTDLVQYLKQKEIKLIPWTINEKEDMQRIIDLGVDGIITDFPDRAMKLLQ